MFVRGVRHLRGDGVARDSFEGFRLLRLAADAGEAEARTFLATLAGEAQVFQVEGMFGGCLLAAPRSRAGA
ncbi:hypothetical protein T492DRAFT_96786 [Pavlovales sp. CCMP2436]|nr:hypothetical protein T492DRAFT_96786 [Pavlovales sp. CCMP2436]